MNLTILFLLINFSTSTPLGIVLPPAKSKDISKKGSRCLRYNVDPREMVVVRINSGSKIRSQLINVKILDSRGNVYREKKDLEDKTRIIFTTSHDSKQFDICLDNVMMDLSWTKKAVSKEVVLDVEIGDDDRNQNSFESNEKYMPVSESLSRVDMMYSVIERDLAGLVEKEIHLRNINEHTQMSYMKFQIVVIVVLVTMGVFQGVNYGRLVRRLA